MQNSPRYPWKIISSIWKASCWALHNFQRVSHHSFLLRLRLQFLLKYPPNIFLLRKIQLIINLIHKRIVVLKKFFGFLAYVAFGYEIQPQEFLEWQLVLLQKIVLLTQSSRKCQCDNTILIILPRNLGQSLECLWSNHGLTFNIDPFIIRLGTQRLGWKFTRILIQINST